MCSAATEAIGRCIRSTVTDGNDPERLAAGFGSAAFLAAGLCHSRTITPPAHGVGGVMLSCNKVPAGMRGFFASAELFFG
jgi:hypothetical protein